MKLARCLFGRGYPGDELVRVGRERVPVLLSGDRRSARLLLLTTGFGSRLTDYGGLTRLFESRYRVARVVHPGSGRWDALLGLVRVLWARMSGLSRVEAARRARRWIHREENYLRRLRQLKGVAEHFRASGMKLSVAGHSFGTDTALRFTLDHPVEALYLFSPHPPGYLIEREFYLRVKAERVWVVTGSRDRTIDGVGPEDRLGVAEAIPGSGPVCLPGVGHMDFAFQSLGPPGWLDTLSRALTPVVGGGEGCSV